ncbi:15-hydroxyprostaglandin dehydrogenase [Trichonephila clavipes]|nr:15-hydroxyprostaglandin dehydrogenase [Trichonephila clavipes]
MPPHGPALSRLDTLCCPEADGPTNIEQPTLNHVQSNTMASAVSADPTRALQGKNRGSGSVMEESENDAGSLEQLLLYVDEHYLAGKLPLGDHLGKVLHGVEEYHQRNVGPLRFHASQLKWTGYHRLWPPRPLRQLCGQCDVE